MDDLENVGTDVLRRWLKTLSEMREISEDFTIGETIGWIESVLEGRE